MEPRISLITLGVADLTRSRAFYQELGWTGQEVQQTVFLQLQGLVLVLWGRAELAADCGIDDTGATRTAATRTGATGTAALDAGATDGFGGIALAHNVSSPAEVDEVLATVSRAGGRITKPASATFYGGYAGYFLDPDGHAWEIAHNPGFAFADDGSVLLPDFG